MWILKRMTLFVLLINILYANSFKIEKVVDGLGIPWGMDFINSHTLLITQKSGSIHIYDIKAKKLKVIGHNLDVLQKGQGGLLDIKVSPKYEEDNWIYISYVKDEKEGVTTLVRGKIISNSLIRVEELLETKSNTGTGYHFGSRITFDKEYLYFTIGDRGERNSAQDISNHNGTVVRLNLDGSIPKDNPFVAKVGLDEIYSYGHRNPQGIFYDGKREILFSIEHGPRGGDEINIIQKGLNYGWPIISYGKEYWNNNMVGVSTHKKGMEQPVKQYTPSIAPSSLIVYSGKLFKEWEGDIFSGALKLRHLNKVSYKNGKISNEIRLLEELNERIRNVVEAPSGEIYLSTDNGIIYKITK